MVPISETSNVSEKFPGASIVHTLTLSRNATGEEIDYTTNESILVVITS